MMQCMVDKLTKLILAINQIKLHFYVSCVSTMNLHLTFVILLTLVLLDDTLKLVLCFDKQDWMAGTTDERMYNDTKSVRMADEISNIISSLGTVMKSKNIIIIFEDSQDILINNIEARISLKFANAHIFRRYSIALNRDIETSFFTLFENVNSQRETIFITIGSQSFYMNLLISIHNADVFSNQQGYFIQLHKWILIELQMGSCSDALLKYVDKIAHIICIDGIHGNDTGVMQPFYMKTAMYGQYIRYWDIIPCLLQQNSNSTSECSFRDIFPNTQFKLNNQHYLIGTELWPGYVELDSSGHLHGLYVEVLNHVAKSFNFTFTVVYPTDRQWGVELPNGSWSGLVGQLERKEVDFVFAPLVKTVYREQVVDFTDFSLFSSYFVGIYKLPNIKTNAFSLYLQPFDTLVWGFILLAIGAASVVMSIQLRSGRTDACYLKTKVFLNYMPNAAFVISTSLVGQKAISNLVKRGNPRYIFVIFCLFQVIIVTIWSAKMMSYLTVSLQNRPIKILEDLLHQNTFEFGVLGQTAIIDYISKSNRTFERRFWGKMTEFARDQPDIFSPNISIQTDKVLDGNYVYIESAEIAYDIASKDCDIVLTDDEYFKHSLGIVVQNNSFYKSYFNDYILRMAEAGTATRMFESLLPKQTCKFKTVYAKHKPILLDTIMSIFIIFIMCLLLSGFVFCIEVYIKNIECCSIG